MICDMLLLTHAPYDDAAMAIIRLGIVGPGIDANQWSNKANSFANVDITGTVLALNIDITTCGLCI